MMEAVKAGAGREDAHSAIKEHAVATVRDLREGKIKENNLIDRLADDTRRNGEKTIAGNSHCRRGTDWCCQSTS